MKSFINVCLKISVTFLAIGLVLCIIGVGLGAVDGVRQLFQDGEYSISFNKSLDKTRKDIKYLEDSTQSFSVDEINNLDVNMNYGEVIVSSYEGTDIKVEAENPTNYFKCKQEGDSLSIVDERSKFVKFTFGLGKDSGHTIVNVYVPVNKVFTTANLEVGAGTMEVEKLAVDDLTIDVGAGECTGKEVIASKQSKVSVGTGYINVDESSFHNLTLDGGTGSVEFSGDLTGDNRLTCGLGEVNVQLKGKETDYNYKIQCDIGEVLIGNDSYSGLGNRQSVDYQAENTIDIDCGVGQVAIEFED